MTPVDLSTTVLHAVRRAVGEDALRAPVPARVRVERTRPGGRGDYASAVALQLAGPAALPAREVAEILRDRLTGAPGIAGVEITGPGFLNFTLDASAGAAAHRDIVRRVREEGERYGYGDDLAGQRLGVVHAREVRAAVTADAVRRLLTAQGAVVRLSCEGEPDADWARLGVATDAYGKPPAGPGADRPASGVAAYGRAADGPDAPGTPLVPVRPVPAGDTAATLLTRLGPDAARWGLLRPAGHDHAPLGPELIVQTEANALFRVRYAYARTRAVVREAGRLGVVVPGDGEDIDATEASAALLALLADHPAVLAAAARHRAPDRLARHLEAVAGAFFDFHDAAPPLPVGDEKPSAAHRSRLAIAEAAGTVLAGGLSLLGVSAPEHL
ncbi:arginine--tRNA ligase [Streptomyces sp. A1277]|uniref:ArgS-related anticodon-binding protein NrtL n=1 Tax=Streptomyces sp. A1277 TaxID=2563103 RepID=UPI0010A29DD6|nr:DALR anticodon-binding domain-containing protein [Streptomyces sp. A1277]THA33580.1 arginine--tRNA ligase [Streptomyces sp. A1277]